MAVTYLYDCICQGVKSLNPLHELAILSQRPENSC